MVSSASEKENEVTDLWVDKVLIALAIRNVELFAHREGGSLT